MIYFTSDSSHNIIKIHNNVCGTDDIMKNMPTFNMNDEIFCRILSIPHNIVLDINNVMQTVN